jgi:hypothetical protein
LESAQVTFVEDVQYPTQLKVRLPEEPQKILHADRTVAHVQLMKNASAAQPQYSTKMHEKQNQRNLKYRLSSLSICLFGKGE